MPNDREWLQAEENGEDALAEMLFAQLVVEMPPIRHAPEFVGLTVQAAWRVRARRRVVMRLAHIAAGLLIGIAALGSMYEFSGLAAALVVRGTVFFSRGLVWLLTTAGEGARWWWTAERIGSAVSDAIAAPSTAAAVVAIEMIALLAIFAFHHLVSNELETRESRKV